MFKSSSCQVNRGSIASCLFRFVYTFKLKLIFIVDASSRCQNCSKLEEEIAELQSLLYTPNDAIPDSVWNVFPENWTYMKKMLIYDRYSTRESLVKLQKKEELEKLFDFIRDMADDADDEERKELLGVFHKNPQKLKILPGLVDVFNAFIENNKKGPSRNKKCRSSSSLNVLASHKSAVSAVYTSAGEIDESVMVESVTEQLEEWLSLKIDGDVLNERLENCKKASFIETFSLRLSTEEKQCICLVCKQPLGLPKKNMKDKTKLSISNVTRHMKNCLMRPDFQLKTTTGKLMSMQTFLNKTQAPPRPSFVNLTDNAQPAAEGTVEFLTEPGESNQVETSVKHAKLETMITRIASHQDSNQCPKNLHQPAGI